MLEGVSGCEGVEGARPGAGLIPREAAPLGQLCLFPRQ